MAYILSLFLFSSLICINQLTLLEIQECAKGPKLWCNSLEYAKKCGAVNHCAGLWLNQKYITKSENQDCQFCLFLLNDVAQNILESEDEDKIKNKIVSSCTILNNQDSKEKCLSLGGEMYYTMKVLIKKQIKPFWICNGIQLCNSTAEMQVFLTSDEVNHENPLDAHDSKQDFILINSDQLVGNYEGIMGDQNLKGDTQSISDSMPLMKLAIGSLAHSNISMDDGQGLFVDMLKELKRVSIESGIQEDNLCDMCQKGVTNLDVLLRSDSFEHDLLKYADKLCADLNNIRDNFMCQEGLKKFLPDMLKILDAKLMTADVCHKAQICTPKIMLFLKNRKQPSANLCGDCKNLVEQMKNFLDKTEPKIMEAAKHFCQSFPQKIQEKCSQMIKEYIPSIYEYVNMLVDPVQMCQALQICQLSSGQTSTPIGDMKMSEAVQLAQNFLLRGVPMFQSFAPTLDKKDVNEQQKQDKDKISLNDLNSVRRYFPIHFNGKVKVVAASQFAEGQEPNSYECKICKIIVEALLKELGDNRTRENIKYQLDRICGILPGNLSKTCKTFIDTYSESLMILLENNSNSTEICQYFDFCQLPDDLSQEDTMNILVSPTQNFNYCPVCHFVVYWISQEIGKNASDEKILNWGKEFCGKLPKSLRQECDDYLDAYGIQALHILRDGMDPDVVCQIGGIQLGICQMKRIDELVTKSPAPRPTEEDSHRISHNLLGSDECSRGPGFWCKSAENAAKCHRTEACQRFYGGFKE